MNVYLAKNMIRYTAISISRRHTINDIEVCGVGRHDCRLFDVSGLVYYVMAVCIFFSLSLFSSHIWIDGDAGSTAICSITVHTGRTAYVHSPHKHSFYILLNAKIYVWMDLATLSP